MLSENLPSRYLQYVQIHTLGCHSTFGRNIASCFRRRTHDWQCLFGGIYGTVRSTVVSSFYPNICFRLILKFSRSTLIDGGLIGWVCSGATRRSKIWKIDLGIFFGGNKCSTNDWLWAARDKRFRKRELIGRRSFACCQRHSENKVSSTPSEPIVAEAAAQVLREENMICGNVRSSLIEKSQQWTRCSTSYACP